jgi:hypothetical protein
MTDKTITFLTFDEAVSAAKNEPDVDFIGLQFVPPFTRLDIYAINTCADEPDNANIQYQGAELFDVDGEEEFYDVDDAPDEAKALFYARGTDLGNGDVQIMGIVSEYVLHQVLPDLKEAPRYKSEQEFIQAAGEQFQSFWYQS